MHECLEGCLKHSIYSRINDYSIISEHPIKLKKMRNQKFILEVNMKTL